MTTLAQGLGRLFRYNLVGAMGLAVKFSVLTGLVELGGADYLFATAFAVEAAVLHNFVWHSRWTWRDRSTGLSRREELHRLWKFHLGTGAVALVSNLLVMRLLAGELGVYYVPANLAATVLAGMANFMISNFFVFGPAERPAPYRT